MPEVVQQAAISPDRLSFESTVRRQEGTSIELEESYFFAESGGQPADRGTIGEIEVIDVRMEGTAIVHDLAEEPPFGVGDVVDGEIDPQFRQYCRRAHTASHVLYGAARRELQDLGYGGFEIGHEKIRIDFAVSSSIDEETMLGLERRANQVVWEDRSVSWEQVSTDAARADADIAFNVATEEVFADADRVRIVTIDGWDRAACGGTHLTSTGSIGPIAVLDRSNPGEGLTRIEFAVGPAAIDAIADRHSSLQRAATLIDAKPTALPDAVQELRANHEAARERNRTLERELARQAVAGFSTVDAPDGRWLVGELPDIDTDVLRAVLENQLSEAEDMAVVGLMDTGTTSISVATMPPLDAARVVDEVTDALGGGGGGGPRFAQGGGIAASPETVEETVRSAMETVFSGDETS